MSDAILITGGTGFIGQMLVDRWLAAGHRITVLSRRPAWVAQRWLGRVQAVSSFNELSGRFDVVVNLAGEGIADRRWSAARKQALRHSRIDLTHNLVAWASRTGQRFRAVLSGSAIGYYGSFAGVDSYPLHEQDSAGQDFAARLCADWEDAAQPLAALSERLLVLRTGVVLGQQGGMLKRLRLPFSLGLGGVIGDGEQVLSWIHADDYCNAVDFLLQSDLAGPVNMTAPHPASNRDFTHTLAQTLHRPALAPLPAFAAKLLFGEMSDLLLKGQRVLPLQLQEQGFEFAYPQLAPALQQLFSR